MFITEKIKETQYRVKLRVAYSKATKRELEIAFEELEKALRKRKKNK